MKNPAILTIAKASFKVFAFLFVITSACSQNQQVTTGAGKVKIETLASGLIILGEWIFFPMADCW